MSTLLSGPSCITPWIEDAAFQSLTKGVHSYAKKPKLVQILSRGGHGWTTSTTTNPNSTNAQQQPQPQPQQQSFLEIHDGQHFIKALLNDTAQKSLGMNIPTGNTTTSSSNATETQLSAAPPHNRAKRGSIVRISDWTLAIKQRQITSNTMNAIVVIMKINGAVHVMGGEDMGIIAHPVNVNESVQVRRVFQSSSIFSQLEHRFIHGPEQLGNVADLFSTTTTVDCTTTNHNNNSITNDGTAATITTTTTSATSADNDDDDGISSSAPRTITTTLEHNNNVVQSILELAKKHKQQQDQEKEDLDGKEDCPVGNVQELLLDSSQVSSVLELAQQQKCQHPQEEDEQHEREQQQVIQSQQQQESLSSLSGVVVAMCAEGAPSSPSPPQAPLPRIIDSDSTATTTLGNVADLFQNRKNNDNSDDNGGGTSATGIEKSHKGNVDVSQILALAKQDSQQQHPKVPVVATNNATDKSVTKDGSVGKNTVTTTFNATGTTATKLEEDEDDDNEEEEEVLGISAMLVEATQDNDDDDHGKSSPWKQSSQNTNTNNNDDEPISLETAVVVETKASSPKYVGKKKNNNHHNNSEYDAIFCTPPRRTKNKDASSSPLPQPQNGRRGSSSIAPSVNNLVPTKANHAACHFFAKLQHHARKGTTAYFDNHTQDLPKTALVQPKHNWKPEIEKKRPMIDIVGWLAKNSVRSPYKKPRRSQQ